MNTQMTPPVSVGEELVVTIEAVGEKGDGIAKKKGFVLFVAGTQRGDKVKIKITKVLSKVGFAEVVEKLEADAPQASGPSEEDLQELMQEDEHQEQEHPEDSEDFGDELDDEHQ